jgi:protein transport protein SEC61 subunit gamma-like protein|tara:strand:+ start:965 stop:1138 length:174 start_codon:yes stop_codon:yes gene_type:complete
MFNLKSFFRQSTRVWKLLKKPSREEFITISKVSAIGLGLVGVLGFAINLLMSYLGLS